MFKTYAERVESTIAFLNSVLDFAKMNSNDIIRLRDKANEAIKSQEVFTLTWETDTTRFDLINFDGYEAGYKPSKVTGFDRLFYDRDKPWSKEILIYNYFTPKLQVTKPDFYILPQAWVEVIERLELNNIKFNKLPKDTIITGEMYIIKDVGNPKVPFNGHFVHSKIEVEKATKTKKFYAGDLLIPMNQVGNRYLIETLEPQARDSFFRWNFFDSILDQREYFSPYVFEETADEMLTENEELKIEFEELKSTDEEFANNARAQLYWLYQRSLNFEADYRLYPVMRIVK
jgi:hypothetical protein